MSMIVSWLPWGFVLVASLWWYWAFLGRETLVRTLGRLGGYWFLIVLILLVDMIAAGRLGADMGLPALFRDDPEVGFDQNSRAVWGAFTATYLVGLVWMIIYLFLYIDPANYNTLPDEKRPIGWNPRAGWAVPCKDAEKLQDYHAALEFLAATTPPFLLLLLMIGTFPADAIGAPAWDWGAALLGSAEYLTGIALGVMFLYIFVRFTWWISGPGARVRDRIGIPRFRNWIWKESPESPVLRIASATSWAVLATNALLAIYPFCFAVRMSPSFAIGMLLCLVALGYFLLLSAPRPFRIPLLLLVMAYVGWSNGDPFKYRFPGIQKAPGASYYLKANLDRGDADRRSDRAVEPRPQPIEPRRPLLKDETVLNRWRDRFKQANPGEKADPKLVLLAVSGGGYRASFWTASVIDALEKRSAPGGSLPGISKQIRLITGASGGMVGASYYVARRAADRKVPANVVQTLRDDTKLDSLSRVVQQLVQGDIPGIFFPGLLYKDAYQARDRGTVFENLWKSLNKNPGDLKSDEGTTFGDLHGQESDGSIPSLIVSPMIVETGERLLISNLDVDAIARPVARLSGNKYNRSGRVFFRMFPGAQDTFQLKTAARMSASFPYVLPAVSLPTEPPVRIVDAGYYDNFGVNLAAAWAYENRDWIAKYTSGLALIQVNAFPRDTDAETTPDKVVSPAGPGAGPSTDTRPATAGDVVAGTRRNAFSFLLSPVEGGMSARDQSMFYRNEEQLRLLDETFNLGQKKKGFFERFIFTFSGQTALNVIIASHDIDVMAENFREAGEDSATNPKAGQGKDFKQENFQTMWNLVNWWKGVSIDPGDKVTPSVPSQAPTAP